MVKFHLLNPLLTWVKGWGTKPTSSNAVPAAREPLKDSSITLRPDQVEINPYIVSADQKALEHQRYLDAPVGDKTVTMPILEYGPWKFRTDLGKGVFQRKPTEGEMKTGVIDVITDELDSQTERATGSTRTKVLTPTETQYFYDLILPQIREQKLYVFRTVEKSGKERLMGLIPLSSSRARVDPGKKMEEEGEYIYHFLDYTLRDIPSPGNDSKTGRPLPGALSFYGRSLRAWILRKEEVEALLHPKE